MLLILERLRIDTRWVVWSTFLALVLVFVSTDSYYSAFHNRAFDPTVSITRSVFWCLFIPIFYMVERKVTDRVGSTIIRAALIHFLPFVLLLIAIALFSSPTSRVFEPVLHWVTQYGLMPVLIYGLYFGLITKFERNTPSGHLSTSSSDTLAEPDRLSIKNGSKRVLLPVEDILYIEAAKPYIKIVTGERAWLYSSSLTGFLTDFPKDYFLRTHKSVIVNSNMIRSISSRKNGDFDLTMCNGDVVRASRNYRDQFRHLL